MIDENRHLRRARRALRPKRLVSAFLTGLAFLAPLLLTAIVLGWVFSQLISFVGPDSVIGQIITAGGRLFTGAPESPLLSFSIGVLLLLAGITALGLLVRDKAKQVLEDAIDSGIGRIPILGGIYRPVAQLVRSMSGSRSEQMASMGVCRVTFGGGIETIAFLASNEIFDIGGGPAKLVLIPTAPVPVGGALILVPVEKVQVIPSMKFEDLARLYLTMGMTPPPQMRMPGGLAAAPEAPAGPATTPPATITPSAGMAPPAAEDGEAGR